MTELEKESTVVLPRDPKLSPFGSFVRRHSRMIAFVGALIVFVTFVVKEGLREHLRASVDSMEYANGVFAILKDNSSIHAELSATHKTINDLKRFLRKRDEASIGSTEDLSDLKSLSDEDERLVVAPLNHITLSLDGAKQLLTVAPASDDLTRDINTAERQLEEIRERNDRITKLLQNQLGSFEQTNDPQYLGEPAGARLELARVEQDTDGLQRLTQSISRRALEASERERLRRQRSYDRYSILSYVLYTLGWGLALIARLYGVESFTGTE